MFPVPFVFYCRNYLSPPLQADIHKINIFPALLLNLKTK